MVEFKITKSSPVYSKLGTYGEAGSGKTTTTALFVIGLHEFIKSTKPVCFLDTETGSDFVRVLFDKAKIELAVIKDRSFKTLNEVIPAALKLSDILIIDSISHPYEDMMQSYLAKTGKKKLAFQDWNVLKPTFYQFTSAYVVAPLHIFICGRSANIWDYFKDEDDKMQLHKVATRMKVEKEMGYEPHLLIEMSKAYAEDGKKLIHRAVIFKDRNPDPKTTLDGKSFDNPTFEDILPHILSLNIGGKYEPVDLQDSQALFQKENGAPEWQIMESQRQIAMEEYRGFLDQNFPSTGKEDKQARININLHLFGTFSQTAIEKKRKEEFVEALAVAKMILSIPENIEILISNKPDFNKIKLSNEKDKTE